MALDNFLWQDVCYLRRYCSISDACIVLLEYFCRASTETWESDGDGHQGGLFAIHYLRYGSEILLNPKRKSFSPCSNFKSLLPNMLLDQPCDA